MKGCTLSALLAASVAHQPPRVVPDYTFDDAPLPRVIVIAAQSGVSPKMVELYVERGIAMKTVARLAHEGKGWWPNDAEATQ